MAIELRHYRYFVAVAEELHFGRAAERLHISQPPLSQQIQSMENQLGVDLFTRTKRHVKLTQAGQLLLPKARALLADADQAERTAVSAGQGETGMLKIGFTGSFPFMPIMPRILRSYADRYPLVALRLREMSTLDQIQDLRNDQIDIGFIRTMPDLSVEQTETEVLVTETLVAVLPSDHPLAASPNLSVEMLSDEPFISYDQSVGAGIFGQIIDICRTAGFEPRIVQQARHMPTIVSLVAAGVGVSFVSPAMQQMNIPNVVYRNLTSDATATNVTSQTKTDLLIATRLTERSPLVRNFLATSRATRTRFIE